MGSWGLRFRLAQDVEQGPLVVNCWGFILIVLVSSYDMTRRALT